MLEWKIMEKGWGCALNLRSLESTSDSLGRSGWPGGTNWDIDDRSDLGLIRWSSDLCGRSIINGDHLHGGDLIRMRSSAQI